ncbi:MAG TPA: cyclic nucleotide-binding domain-containing protein, partial [Anaerolineae bacterium]|nr:cyclic nucleotide-binding domain-containing protein [Anaerolineae bacterium]
YDTFPHLQKMLDKAAHDRSLRLLLNNPLFGSLPVKALRRLAATTEEARFRKNQVIFEGGGEPTALYVVKEGSVMLSLDNLTSSEAQPGTLLDFVAVARGQPHTATAKAMALNTRLLVIPVAEVRGTLASEPEWEAQLVESDGHALSNPANSGG